MQTIFRILVIPVFLFIWTGIVTSLYAQESNLKALSEWQQAKNSDGVIVYVRKIEAEPGRVERQLFGIGHISLAS